MNPISSQSSIQIPGVGVISAAGAGIPATLASFKQGQRNPTSAQPYSNTLTCPTFQVSVPLPELPGRKNHSRTLRLAMFAVREALAQAHLDSFPLSSPRVGVCIGTTVASQLNSLPFYQAYRQTKNPPLDPVYDYLQTNLAQAIAELLHLTGPRLTIVNACSSGTDAIGIAASWIRAGLCDLAIAGGADEMSLVPLAGFHALGVMSSQPCAPFDRDRSGLNLGEGAVILILESARHARSRQHHTPFELAGFGAAADAHHLTAPHPEGRGLTRAIHTALAQSCLAPADIAFINAHGTATQDNDRVEANTFAKIFPHTTPFLSTKGYTGHTLGAAGGLEAAFTLLALREGWIPPSAGFANQPDDIPIAPVRSLTPIHPTCAISTSLAFGGNNAALIIRRIA